MGGQKVVEFERRSVGRLKILYLRNAFSLISLFFPLLLLIQLAACSSQSTKDELAKELKTVESWAATAETVGDAWTRGHVPTAYAEQTLKKTQEELHKEADKLRKAQASTDMEEQLKRLEDTVGRMSEAAKKQDSQTMTQQMQQLARQKQTMSKLANMASRQS